MITINCADCGQKYTWNSVDDYRGSNCGQCGAPLDDDWRKSRNHRRVKTFLDLLSMDIVELEDSIDHAKRTIEAIREIIKEEGGK